MKRITTRILRANNACEDQIKEFRRRFRGGFSAETEDEAVRAAVSVASVFDWTWAAYRLLSWDAHSAYNNAIMPAWRAYLKGRPTTLADYVRVKATAFAKAWWNDN